MDMSKLALACLLWGHEWTVPLGILEGAELDHRLNRSAVLTVGSTQDGGLLEYRYAQDDAKRLIVSKILSAFVLFMTGFPVIHKSRFVSFQMFELKLLSLTLTFFSIFLQICIIIPCQFCDPLLGLSFPDLPSGESPAKARTWQESANTGQIEPCNWTPKRFYSGLSSCSSLCMAHRFNAIKKRAFSLF
jgi:hypothetical protein